MPDDQRVTCPKCVGQRVELLSTQDDPLGNYQVCSMCLGFGRVAGERNDVRDEIAQLIAHNDRRSRIIEHHERHIERLHQIRRDERAQAYLVAQRHGFVGTYREFCDELFATGQPKPCAECGRVTVE